ncbi:MAG: elongation factor P [Planctomycetaceae bacterium]|nr:elongation factor P [Planctomycetaceae bacterium]
MAVPVEKLKKGGKVLLESDPYEILEINFVKPGKGQALYKTRLRNLLKGGILDRTFRSGDALDEADVHRSNGSYSYRDGENYYYLDNDSFEQYALPASAVADQMTFLMEGSPVQLLFWNGQLISMSPPQQVVMEVTYTEPAAKGDTATNVTKGATLECGAQIQVPAFIRQGDKIKIDVESGTYMERVST